MTTIYVDSRKTVAGSDSDFEVDLGESLHLQSDARLAVYKIRLADSFLSIDRGRYLYWVDAALGTLNWALLPEQVFEFVRMMAHNEVYLRCAQLANASRVLGNDILSKITLKSGVGTIVETGSDDGHFMALRGMKVVEDAGALQAPTNSQFQYGDVQLGAVDSMTVRSTEGRETLLKLALPAPQRQRGGPTDETGQAGGCKAAGRLPGASEAQDHRLAFFERILVF